MTATFTDVDDLMENVGLRPLTTIEDGIQMFSEWYKEYFFTLV